MRLLNGLTKWFWGCIMSDDNDLYTNMLAMIDSNVDYTFEKYATVMKLYDNGFCCVREAEESVEHDNVPILNGAGLRIGDTVILGFLNDSIYEPVCLGMVGRQLTTGTEAVVEAMELSVLGLPAVSSQHEINLRLVEKIVELENRLDGLSK